MAQLNYLFYGNDTKDGFVFNVNAFRRQHIIIFAFIFAFPFVYVGSYFFPLLSFGVFGLFETSSSFSLYPRNM